MMYTKEQMIEAYLSGYAIPVKDDPWADAERYVDSVMGSEGRPRKFENFSDAPHGQTFVPLTANAPRNDESRSGHLPPVGTPEEVLARVVASLLYRTALMFHDGQQFPALFSIAWQEANMEALRTAYPILGALEDAREEVKA